MFRILRETPDDSAEVEYLLDLAFAPGRTALSSYRLREGVDPVPGLSLIARDEYDRAYQTLSDQLRRKSGISSRGDFTDAWVVGGGMAVAAIRRSKATGPPAPLEDGRVLDDRRRG